jgi:hypothetical protein
VQLAFRIAAFGFLGDIASDFLVLPSTLETSIRSMRRGQNDACP